MKEVIYEDRRGYKRKVLIPDHVDDSEAELGIPLHADIVEIVDWDELKRAINNIFVDKGVCDWNTLQRSGAMDQSLAATKRHLIAAVRNAEKQKSSE